MAAHYSKYWRPSTETTSTLQQGRINPLKGPGAKIDPAGPRLCVFFPLMMPPGFRWCRGYRILKEQSYEKRDRALKYLIVYKDWDRFGSWKVVDLIPSTFCVSSACSPCPYVIQTSITLTNGNLFIFFPFQCPFQSYRQDESERPERKQYLDMSKKKKDSGITWSVTPTH